MLTINGVLWCWDVHAIKEWRLFARKHIDKEWSCCGCTSIVKMNEMSFYYVDIKICRAISTGCTLLLVDVEREKLGTKFDNLLKGNIKKDKDGKQMLRIGDRSIDYHPGFRLYLYSNIPLELSGKNWMNSLLRNHVVINMSLNFRNIYFMKFCY